MSVSDLPRLAQVAAPRSRPAPATGPDLAADPLPAVDPPPATDPAPAAEAVRLRPPRSAYVLLAAGAALIPWLVVLASVQQRWTVTWVGLDAMEALGLVATGLLTLRAHPMRSVVASVTAALLVIDAWFDLTTSPAGALLPAVLMATLAELPLAALCGYHAMKNAGQARK